MGWVTERENELVLKLNDAVTHHYRRRIQTLNTLNYWNNNKYCRQPQLCRCALLYYINMHSTGPEQKPSKLRFGR